MLGSTKVLEEPRGNKQDLPPLSPSFLLAVLNRRDTLHPRAQAWAAAVVELLLVTEYVVWEMVNGLSLPAEIVERNRPSGRIPPNAFASPTAA